MIPTVKVIANERKFVAKINRVRVDVTEAVNIGLAEGGKEVTDFIKYELLEGQLVKKRSGELQRGVYFRRGKNKVTIHIRGKHADVGKWIDEGLEGTWIIVPKYAKRLTFRVTSGPNGGKWVSTTKVIHPGIKPRYFMRKAAKAKRNRVEQLLRVRVRAAATLAMRA